MTSRQLVGVYLTIWARNAFVEHISGVQTLAVATGMMGYLGNKGKWGVVGDVCCKGSEGAGIACCA